MEKIKIIKNTTITVLLSSAFSNYGMDSKEQNNQETTPKEIEGKIQQQNCCNEICQEINEDFIDNPKMNKEEMWDQIEKSKITIEKIKNYLKISFPEIKDIKDIKEELSINFESDNTEDNLNEIFKPFNNKEVFIKNGEKLIEIKKSIFTKFRDKPINYSFCIIPQKDNYEDIKIYFTCEGLEKKIYATFSEETKKKSENKKIYSVIENQNKVKFKNQKNEEIKEKKEQIFLSQNISSNNDNIIIENNINKNLENFTIENKKNHITITFLNKVFNKDNREKIRFHCFPEEIFTPYNHQKGPIKNNTLVSEIKTTIFNTKKDNCMSIKYIKNKEINDYNIYFTIEGIDGKFYADKIAE